MIALADPPLNVFQASSPAPQQSRAASLKLSSIFVRQEVRGNPRVNAKTQMDHALGRHNRALGRGDVIPQLHCGVDDRVDGTRSLGTEGVLRKIKRD